MINTKFRFTKDSEVECTLSKKADSRILATVTCDKTDDNRIWVRPHGATEPLCIEKECITKTIKLAKRTHTRR